MRPWDEERWENPSVLDWLYRARDQLVRELAEFANLNAPLVGGVRIWGIGVKAAPVTTPLMLADESDLRFNLGWEDAEPQADFEPRFDRGLPTMDRGLPTIPVEVSPQLREIVSRWEVPPNTELLPVGRPEALGVREVLAAMNAQVLRSSASRERGTVCGSARRLEGRRSGFLTVGHVAGPEGAQVEIQRRRGWFRRSAWDPAGTVVCSSDPAGTPGEPGWDVAVVEGSNRRWTGLRGVEHLPPQIPEPLPAVMVGGISGRTDVEIGGALMAYGNSERLWANSWMMSPSGSAVHGDSGSAVVTPDGGVIGILVGGARRRGKSTFNTQYVQDMESLCREFLHPQGFTVA